MKNLATLDYWTKTFQNHNTSLNENDAIKVWLLEYLNFNSSEECIEIGCYPGKYLTIPGDFGVQVNGIDFIKDVSKLSTVFSEKGYNVGSFICQDFTENCIKRKFDYVMSFGFIEHFDKWQMIIQKHCDLVAENGFLIIEAPNFKGFFQRIPRFLFDNTDFKRHNLNSMILKEWENILKKNGFEIITAEYFGGYDLWFDKNPSNKYELFLRKLVVSFLKRLQTFIYGKTVNNKSFSSFMGVIAKRK